MDQIRLQTEAAAVADVVREHIKPVEIRVDDPENQVVLRKLIALPKGLDLYSIKEFEDEYRTRPERRTGTATMQTLESFIGHAKRFADANSALFANPSETTPSLTAVLDYHEQTAAGLPRFGTHRTHYAFPLSEEWKAWVGMNGKQMNQQQFAEWIESRILDVTDPANAGAATEDMVAAIEASLASPSTLLQLSRGLTIRVNSKVKEVRNTQTGEMQIAYETEHQDERGAPLKVPGAFLLALRAFRGGAYYQVAARLRHRVQGTTMLWHYDLYRHDRVLEDAVLEAAEKAKDGTGLPLFIGAPE